MKPTEALAQIEAALEAAGGVMSLRNVNASGAPQIEIAGAQLDAETMALFYSHRGALAALVNLRAVVAAHRVAGLPQLVRCDRALVEAWRAAEQATGEPLTLWGTPRRMPLEGADGVDISHGMSQAPGAQNTESTAASGPDQRTAIGRAKARRDDEKDDDEGTPTQGEREPEAQLVRAGAGSAGGAGASFSGRLF